jgi:hypothetical protein
MSKPKSGAKSTSDLLMSSLSKFYSTKSNVLKVKPIINGESDISLRLIDWFITNYSKKYSTIITRKVNNNIVHLNVFLSYRSQLKSYSKSYFDPFRRKDRVKFYYDKDNYLETTIGQLNMFRWILVNDILEFVKEHKDDIEADMIATQKENQKRKLNKDNIKVKVIETENGLVTKTRKKRNELSKSVLKNMNKLSGVRTIQFD